MPGAQVGGVSEEGFRFSRWMRLAAAAVSGGVLALAYPPFSVDGVVWVALVPLMLALWLRPAGETGKQRLRRGFGLGWLAGAVFFLINVKWIQTVTGPGQVVLALYLGLYPAVWGAFAATVGAPDAELGRSRFCHAGRNLGRAALNAAAWTGLEWLRGLVFTGFSWNTLSAGLVKNLALIQLADVVGQVGLSFLVVFAASVAAGLVGRVVLRPPGRRAFSADLAVALLLLVSCFLYGLQRMSRKPGGEAPKQLRTLVVQTGVPQEEKIPDEEHVKMIAQRLADLTSLYVPGQKFDLVVWPESALPLAYNEEFTQSFFNETLSQGDFSLVTGIDHQTMTGMFNAVVLAKGKTGEGTSVHHKVHLVPFGEYLPLRWFPPFRWMIEDLIPFDFDAGETTDPLPLPDGSGVQVIPLVCFEDTVGRLARQFVRPTPQVMVNVTNDAWFLDSEGSEQHLVNAVFRCIELRRPMVRAANTGVSAFIDETGSLYDRTQAGSQPRRLPVNVQGTLPATILVPASGEMTFYARFGDVFSVGCLVVALLAAGVKLLAGRKPEIV